jgi:hypothetical protein
MLRVFPAAILALCAAACAKPPAPPYDIPSSSVMQPGGADGLVRYVNPAADFRRYDSVFIEPVRIYLGAGGRFGTTALEDRQEVARHMQTEFARAFAEDIPVAPEHGPTALRLRLIMVGMQTTQPLLAATTHFSLSGMAINIGRSVLGMKGAFTGSVTYIAEFYDSESDFLLAAIQAERGAHALDVTEDISTLGSAKVGVEKGARQLRDMLMAWRENGATQVVAAQGPRRD